jgi:hypothetical protein
MTNLDVILSTLIDSDMPESISQKIDETLNSFNIDALFVSSHEEFNDCIGGFIRQIYGNGLVLSKTLDSHTALAEAINILEQYYENQGASGYDAAYLDVIDETGKGIQFVLRELAELVKAMEVSRWLNSVYISLIDPIDKNQHLEIVKSLLEKYSDHFSTGIKESSPVSFIKSYRELIEIVISSENLNRHIIGSKRNLGLS